MANNPGSTNFKEQIPNNAATFYDDDTNKVPFGYVDNGNYKYDKDVNNYNFALLKEILSGQNLYLINLFYPIGTVYTTTDSTFNPNVYFQGTTWVQLEDCFLASEGSQIQNGGAATVTLTEDNLPEHNHDVNISDTGHTHEIPEHYHHLTSADEGNSGLIGYTGGNWNSAVKQSRNLATKDFVFTDTSSSTPWAYIYASGSGNFNDAHETSWAIKPDGTTEHANNNKRHTESSTTDITASTEEVGGNVPFSIIPPYEKVYFWKRVTNE